MNSGGLDCRAMSYFGRLSFSLLFVGLVFGGCKSRPTVEIHVDAGGELDLGTVDGPVEAAAPADAFIVLPDVGIGTPCVRRTSCIAGGGQYCGSVNDGCGGILACGDCPSGQTCGTEDKNRHVCISADPSCKPLTCDRPGGRLCGKVGDGCGGLLECPDACPTGQSCGAAGIAGVCGASPGANCKPITCDQPNGHYCGVIGDGCGKNLDCGTCPGGLVCGTGTHANVCLPATCAAPLPCKLANGQYCGKVGDGCGNTIDCGDCPAGQTCGGRGTHNVCAAPPDATCKPLTCDPAGGGRYCGKIGDGCGNLIDCGGCPDGRACMPGGICPGGPPCEGVCKQQMKCASGADTTVSRVVLAPTPPAFGTPDPIYSALVYVPNAPVLAFPPGATCGMCNGAEASGKPLVTTLSGADGKFVLKNVPVGINIPLVIQVGRWRRQVTIPTVNPCVDNPVGPDLTRLPRNKAEGDIPLTAIATGKVDTLECVLRKIGVDESEYTVPTGDGRIHIYRANGANRGAGTPTLEDLTGSLDTLRKYDMSILECEGSEIAKAMANKQNVIDYANVGGRLFFTHYSYTYLWDVMPFVNTAAWVPPGRHGQKFYPTSMDAPLTGIIDQSFPKGIAFAQWLQIVGATNPMPGQIQIGAPRHDLDAVVP